MTSIELDPVVEGDIKAYLETGGAAFPTTIVLGASGMLGSYIVSFVAGVNKAYGISEKATAVMRGFNPYIDYLLQQGFLEVSDFKSISRLISSKAEPLVIHAASPASIQSHLADPKDMVNSNIALTLEVCAAMSFSKGHLTYLSSGEVYGPNAIIPTREQDYSAFDHLGIRGSYPELKRAAEVIVQTWANAENFSASSLRVYHTFGPGLRENDERIFATALKSVLRKENIVLNSRGEATRSFLYTADLARSINLTCRESGFEEYNVASGSEITILEFAKVVASLQPGVEVTSAPDSQITLASATRSPILRGAADTSKLKSKGWTQKFDLDQALSRTLLSMKWRSERKFSSY
jgi:nucleoside-diphosphate-sugar epimerase